MSRGHGTSRRQAYGRRMKDLRTRRAAPSDVDLDGPDGWTRGDSWDGGPAVHGPDPHVDGPRRGAPPR